MKKLLPERGPRGRDCGFENSAISDPRRATERSQLLLVKEHYVVHAQKVRLGHFANLRNVSRCASMTRLLDAETRFRRSRIG